MTEIDTDTDIESASEESTTPESARPPSERHVDNRTVVFPDLRVLYVPVPKAGCTAMLWALATAAGLEEERFYASHVREVSRSLTIHDLGRWPEEFLFSRLDDEKKAEILAADDWFRFTVVRDPFRRVWSAWQSKVLLSEPQFADKFSSCQWFPTSVGSANDIVAGFRTFVDALDEDADLITADVHWAPQVTLIAHDRVRHSHVGRIEEMDATINALRRHLGPMDKTLPEVRRANPAPLPYTDELLEDEHVQTLTHLFAEDMNEFGYDAPKVGQGPVPADWTHAVEAALPSLSAIRQRNERVGDLQQVFLRTRREMNNELLAERRRGKRLEQRVRELQGRLSDAKADLARLRNSASWRYTAPLRRLSGVTRNAVGRFRK